MWEKSDAGPTYRWFSGTQSQFIGGHVKVVLASIELKNNVKRGSLRMKNTELDPNSVDAMRRMAKNVLRKRLSAIRKALPPSSMAERSARIVARLEEHPWVQASRAVALYAPMLDRREVDISPLRDWFAARNVRVYYPFMTKIEAGYDTGFRHVAPNQSLAYYANRFAEPCSEAPRASRGDVDLVIVPTVAVSLDGYRVGTGSGFYDATLPDVCPPAKSIVVGYDFQLLVEVPSEAHDWRCDAVVTDAEQR